MTGALGRLACTLSLCLLIGPQLAAAAGPDRDRGLLRLAGRFVKWGAPAYESPAEITYAYLTAARFFPDARNCAAMVPITKLLSRSRIELAAFDKEMTEAFRLWTSVTNIRFSRVEDAERADIIIGAQADDHGVAFTNVFQGPPGRDGIDRIARSTICLDPSERWESGIDGDPKSYNLRYVATHEIGHAIGLDHLGRDGGIMGFAYRETVRSPAEIRLGTADIAAVTRLYGRATRHTATASPPARSSATGPDMVCMPGAVPDAAAGVVGCALAADGVVRTAGAR